MIAAAMIAVAMIAVVMVAVVMAAVVMVVAVMVVVVMVVVAIVAAVMVAVVEHTVVVGVDSIDSDSERQHLNDQKRLHIRPNRIQINDRIQIECEFSYTRNVTE